MYEIRVGDETLYYAGDSECTITAGKLIQSLNEAGSLEITMPANNPFYNRIMQRKTELTLYQDNKQIWNGEVREVSSDFYKNKTVYTVGEMSYLSDSILPLKKYDLMSKSQIFSEIINEHNSQVEERKRFEVGVVGITDGLFTMVTNWENTLDYIRGNLLSDDECIRIRHFDGKRYIDLIPLDSYGVKSEQYIEFGDNLLDLTESTNSESLYTAVIPLGAAKEESSIDDYDDYITIESVNSGKNYVFNENAVSNYGWIKTVVNFDEIEDVNELKQKGIEWLTSNQYEKFTYKLSAVDLSLLDKGTATYDVGDYIRAISEPHGMDVWLPVRKREIDLLNMANNKLTLGATTQKSFTRSTYSSVKDLEEKMPEESKILKTAKKNASSLINANGENGYVSIRTDANGKPYEIDVMNASSFKQSTQVWRWNLSGFGHGTKSAGSDDVEWNADVAITMNGAINADFITAGSMAADRIKGGELTIGGTGFAKDGSIKVYNAQGDNIGMWDKNGIKVTSGEISGAKIVASSGEIGAFYINAEADGSYYSGLVNPNNGLHIPRSANAAIYIGSFSDPDIELNKDGKITCKELKIDGWSHLTKYLQQLKDQDLIED